MTTGGSGRRASDHEECRDQAPAHRRKVSRGSRRLRAGRADRHRRETARAAHPGQAVNEQAPAELDLDLGAEARSLRARLRALLAEELPADWITSFSLAPDVQAVVSRICRRLADDDLLTLSWPAEYGGAEADLWQQTVLREEMWAHFEPRGPQYMGLNWVGPVLMEVGTGEQRARHLP